MSIATRHDTAASAASIAAGAAPTIVNNVLNRSKAMQLMHEVLARAHSEHRLEEQVRYEYSRRVLRAHRAARGASDAVLHARLLARAIIR